MKKINYTIHVKNYNNNISYLRIILISFLGTYFMAV